MPALVAVALALWPAKPLAATPEAANLPGVGAIRVDATGPPRNSITNDLPGWSFISEGGAEGSMAQDSADPLNEKNPHSLRLSVTNLGTRCGVSNFGDRGINVQAGQWYDASFYARKAVGRGVGLVFSLESTNGKVVCARATIPEVGARDWRQYTLALHAYGSDPHCRLVITPIEPCTIWLASVSFFPRESIKERPDLLRPELKQQPINNP